MLSTAGLSIYPSTTVICLSFLQSSVHPQIVLRLLYSRNSFLYNTHDCKTSVLSLPFQRLFRNMHIALMTVVLSDKAYNIFVCTDHHKIYVFSPLLQSDILFRIIGTNYLSIPHPLLWESIPFLQVRCGSQ